jgi:hypothetical protein
VSRARPKSHSSHSSGALCCPTAAATVAARSLIGIARSHCSLSPKGVPDPVMTVAHGFTVEQMAELAQAGLITKDVQRMRRRNILLIQVTWLRITDAGLAAETRGFETATLGHHRRGRAKPVAERPFVLPRVTVKGRRRCSKNSP